jgi:Bacteriocin-protection, YdeI or OmpD-Associated/Domain of unknown function (DUF1905)
MEASPCAKLSGVAGMTPSKAYTTTLETAARGKARVPVPFDPNTAWGAKAEHRVAGTIDGVSIRGSIVKDRSGWCFSLGPAWLRDGSVGPGDRVHVVIMPEGPQRDDLAVDIAAALDANPDAGAFFDALAQFYRKAYLRWIDATQRNPELRARRIAEVVQLLGEGHRQRPDTSDDRKAAARPEPKTKPTDASVGDFLAAVAPDGKRADAIALDQMIRAITKLPAIMWGTSIVGYGARLHHGSSGASAAWPLIGFSPRKANLVIYLDNSLEDAMFGDLGKHRRGVGCLYLNRIADVDTEVLGAIINESFRRAQA